MRHKKLKLSILLLGLGLTAVKAQEAVTAGGGDGSGVGGSFSYSIGQAVYTTNMGSSGSIDQGVQHPYEITVVTGLEEAKGISLNCVAYPNPVTNLLMLKIESLDLQTLSFQLYSIQGKLLKTQKITDPETPVAMGEFSSGNYFLKVIDNDKEVIIFKINKN